MTNTDFGELLLKVFAIANVSKKSGATPRAVNAQDKGFSRMYAHQEGGRTANKTTSEAQAQKRARPSQRQSKRQDEPPQKS